MEEFKAFSIKGRQKDIKLFDFIKLRSKSNFMVFLPLILTTIFLVLFTILLFIPVNKGHKVPVLSYVFTYLAFALMYFFEISSLLMLPIKQKKYYEAFGDNDIITIYEDRFVYSSMVKDREVDNPIEISIFYNELRISKADSRNYYFVDSRGQGLIISKSNEIPSEHLSILEGLIAKK